MAALKINTYQFVEGATVVFYQYYVLRPQKHCAFKNGIQRFSNFSPILLQNQTSECGLLLLLHIFVIWNLELTLWSTFLE